MIIYPFFQLETPKLSIEDKKQKKMISILEELSKMEEEKIIPHCLLKLREEGLDVQIDFIQASLLEAAYVKIGIILAEILSQYFY